MNLAPRTGRFVPDQARLAMHDPAALAWGRAGSLKAVGAACVASAPGGATTSSPCPSRTILGLRGRTVNDRWKSLPTVDAPAMPLDRSSPAWRRPTARRLDLLAQLSSSAAAWALAPDGNRARRWHRGSAGPRRRGLVRALPAPSPHATQLAAPIYRAVVSNRSGTPAATAAWPYSARTWSECQVIRAAM